MIWNVFLILHLLLTQLMFADLKGIFCCKQSSWVPDENLGPVGPYKEVKTILSKIFKMSSCIESENSRISKNTQKVLIRLHLIYHCVCVPAHLILIPFVAKVFDQTLHAFRCRAPPVGPGIRTKGLVPDREGAHKQQSMCRITTWWPCFTFTLFYRITFKLYDSIVSTQCQPVVCASHSDVGSFSSRLSVLVMVHVLQTVSVIKDLKSLMKSKKNEYDFWCCYLWRKISYLRRYANPARLTLRCSIRPRYFTWCLTSTSSKRPAMRDR